MGKRCGLEQSRGHLWPLGLRAADPSIRCRFHSVDCFWRSLKTSGNPARICGQGHTNLWRFDPRAGGSGTVEVFYPGRCCADMGQSVVTAAPRTIYLAFRLDGCAELEQQRGRFHPKHQAIRLLSCGSWVAQSRCVALPAARPLTVSTVDVRTQIERHSCRIAGVTYTFKVAADRAHGADRQEAPGYAVLHVHAFRQDGECAVARMRITAPTGELHRLPSLLTRAMEQWLFSTVKPAGTIH